MVVVPLLRSSFELRRGARLRLADLCQGFDAYELQAFLGVVAMDFVHIELAHEVDGFLGDDLSWHHDREAGRVRNHETGGDEFRTSRQATIALGITQAEDSAN